MTSDLRIKVCGLTRFEDASLALDLGAWALGFILYSKSPRALKVEQLSQLLKKIPPQESGHRARYVTVFVNPSLDEVMQVVDENDIDVIQLHGEESPEFCNTLKRRLPKGIEIFKALRLSGANDFESASQYLTQYSNCDALLLDSFIALNPEMRGGTGVENDFSLLATFQKYLIEKKLAARLIVSGGLNEENIAKAHGAIRPFAFDVSSGLEDSPGHKSQPKMQRFFDKLRGLHATT